VEAKGSQQRAAEALNCSRTTVWAYCRRYPAVAEACARLQEGGREGLHYSPEQVAEALRQAGGSQKQAARRLGCTEGTVAQYRSRFPIVAEAYRPLSARPGRRRFTPEEVSTALWQAGGVQEEAARRLECTGETIAAYRACFPGVQEAFEQGWRKRGRGGGLAGNGHYRRFTAEEVAAALLKARGNKARACRLLECGYRTLMRYFERYPAVGGAYREAREQQLDLVESRLAAAVEAGEWKAVAFVLSVPGKERGYDPHRRLEPKAVPSDMPRDFARLVRQVYARRDRQAERGDDE
jgi:hypothetical protein